jgi:hypothetical protein
MIMEVWLPRYLAYGVPYDVFMASTPNKMRPYDLAQEAKLEQADYLAWLQGIYIRKAFSDIIGAAFSKNSSADKFSYFDKPILAEAIEDARLTPEERQQKELAKMLAAEEAWILHDRLNLNLPETEVGKEG